MAGVGDDYVAPWRRGCQSLGQSPAPALNSHLVQLKPRTDRRPAALVEACNRERAKVERRFSGHSLIR